MGLVGIGNGVIEALFDTGGARTMLDKKTALLLGLTITRPPKGQDFGTFVGPGGKS
jgi:hypothetical protein